MRALEPRSLIICATRVGAGESGALFLLASRLRASRSSRARLKPCLKPEAPFSSAIRRRRLDRHAACGSQLRSPEPPRAPFHEWRARSRFLLASACGYSPNPGMTLDLFPRPTRLRPQPSLPDAQASSRILFSRSRGDLPRPRFSFPDAPPELEPLATGRVPRFVRSPFVPLAAFRFRFAARIPSGVRVSTAGQLCVAPDKTSLRSALQVNTATLGRQEHGAMS